MKNSLKYCILTLAIMLMSFAFMQRHELVYTYEDTSCFIVRDLCAECIEYQHSVYEPQKDICLVSGNGSSNATFRLQKCGKRNFSGNNKSYILSVNFGKDFSDKLGFAHSNLRHSYTIFHAKPQLLLIRFGKLVI